MDNKKILKCALAAIFTMLLKFIYSRFFGNENALLGLMTGVVAYILLTVDFKSEIKYNSVILILLNLFLGIMAYFSGLSLILELFINIITIFTVSFIYMRRNQSIVSFSFLLLYITMCNNKVSLEHLPTRLFALLFGVIIIILGQVIFNKNKFKKSSKALILNSIKNIMGEINNIIEGKYTTGESIKIDNKLRTLLASIDAKNKRKKFKDANDRMYFNIVVVLERLNIIINEVFSLDDVEQELKDAYYKDIYNELEIILKFIEGKESTSETLEDTNNFIEVYSEKAEDNSFIYESIELMKILNQSINNINSISKVTNINNIDKISNVSKITNISNIDKISNVNNINNIDKINSINSIKSRDSIIRKVVSNRASLSKSWILNFKGDVLDFESVRFKFSLRLAAAIAIAMLIVNYFEIPYGSWMITSIFVVIQPYREDTVAKAKNRVKGTIVGALASVLMFYLFPEIISSAVFITFVLFMYYYVTGYFRKVIWMSLLVIASAIGSGAVEIISLNRVIFVLSGIGIALIFNRIFLPFGIENSVDRLRKIYSDKLVEIFEEAKKLMNGKEDQRDVFKLILEGNLIETRLINNIDILDDKSLEEAVYKQSTILSDIRFLILEIYYAKDRDNVKDKDRYRDREISHVAIRNMIRKIEGELGVVTCL